MNSSNLYTRTRLGLDSRVWMVLIITILISAALFGFKMATHQPCQVIEIMMNNNDVQIEGKFFPQDRISFEANMAGTKEVVWDFGDGTPTAKGKTIIHSYGNPGSYFVTAIINGKCKEFIPIVISTRFLPTVAGTGNNMPMADITGPDAPKAGEPAAYATSLNSTTYEWNVLNSPEYPTQKTPVVNFTFNTPGAKTLELKLDGGKIYRKTIQVLPGDVMPQQPIDNGVPDMGGITTQPEDPTPELPSGPKSTFIADEVFKQMFEAVAKGDKDASSFNQYLCNGSQTKVRDNGDSWTTVGEFCSKIHDKKKYDIKSVTTVRDPNDKCVLQLQIKYKKKGFLGL